MKVLLYARESEATGNRLQSFLETHVPGCKVEMYRTIEGLAERLKAPHEGGVVAVLEANSREDLTALLSLHHRLQDIKTILLVLPKAQDDPSAQILFPAPPAYFSTHRMYPGGAELPPAQCRGVTELDGSRR